MTIRQMTSSKRLLHSGQPGLLPYKETGDLFVVILFCSYFKLTPNEDTSHQGSRPQVLMKLPSSTQGSGCISKGQLPAQNFSNRSQKTVASTPKQCPRKALCTRGSGHTGDVIPKFRLWYILTKLKSASYSNFPVPP
ncbi:hypothetical protein AOLI_G00302270 [Acnodon oligacanthus]